MQIFFLPITKANVISFGKDAAMFFFSGFLLGCFAFIMYKNVDPQPVPGQLIFFVLFMSLVLTSILARAGVFLSFLLETLFCFCSIILGALLAYVLLAHVLFV